MADKNKDKDPFDLDNDISFDDLNGFDTGTGEELGTDAGFDDFANASADAHAAFDEAEASDPFSVDADGSFDFGGPPSPESVELDSLAPGNPDEEFSEFGGEDDGQQGGYDPFSSYAGSDENVDGQPSADPFPASYSDEQETSPAANDNAATGASGLMSKLPVIGAVAAAAVVGWIGYAQLLPMFMPSEQPQVAVQTKVDDTTGQFPTQLPAKSTNVQQQPDATVKVDDIKPDTAPVGDLELKAPDIDIDVGLGDPAVAPEAAKDGVQPAAVEKPVEAVDPVATAPETAADDIDIAVEPAANPVAVEKPVETVEVKPAGDPNEEPGGLEAIRANEAASSEVLSGINTKLEDIFRRLDSVEKKVASLVPVSPQIAQPGDVPSLDLPVGGADRVAAPLKPRIIENVVLRGVASGTAWISTESGMVEVKVGDKVAGAGTIESLQNYRGRWIAVTEQGIILPK